MSRSSPKPQFTLTAAELSALTGVATDTVKQHAGRGAPHRKQGGRKPRLFNLEAYNAWRRENQLTGRRGRPCKPHTASMEEAKLRKELALAERHELAVDRLRSQLINESQHVAVCAALASTAVSRLRRLPSEVGPLLTGLSGAEIEDAIDLAVRGICESLADPSSYRIAPMGGST